MSIKLISSDNQQGFHLDAFGKMNISNYKENFELSKKQVSETKNLRNLIMPLFKQKKTSIFMMNMETDFWSLVGKTKQIFESQKIYMEYYNKFDQ